MYVLVPGSCYNFIHSISYFIQNVFVNTHYQN